MKAAVASTSRIRRIVAPHRPHLHAATVARSTEARSCSISAGAQRVLRLSGAPVLGSTAAALDAMEAATLGRNRRIAPERRHMASDCAQPDVPSPSWGRF